MAINITMPALSPTMEEGILAKWLVKTGDSVSAGDVIAEIETDKATMEVEAVDEGVVANLVVAAGTEGVKVNAVIAVLAEEGEDVKAIAAAPVNAPQSTSVSPEPSITPPSPSIIPPSPSAPTPPSSSAPTPPSSSAPTPPSSSGLSRGPTEVETNEGATRIFASPLARRIARDKGIDLSTLKGSGPHGRIVRRDVDAAETSAPSAASVPAITPTQSDAQILKNFAEGSYDLVPHDNMRKIIARRLVESKQTVPHFYLNVECELDALLAIRAKMNKAAPLVDEKPAYKISVNDMIIKAMGLALRDIPDANVSWTSANMVLHKHCDVGVAVSIPGGLITPVIRRAEEKSLSAISNEMKDLAVRARSRKLKPQEYQGGATAVSNLGMFGIKEFAAVINPPQATILAVGIGEKRAVVKDGEISVATLMSATLSTDHRAVDGVLGAKLLGAFKRYIENPVAMLV